MNDHDKLPLHEYRADLPLTDTDFAAIRATVMTKIAARKRSRFAGLGWRLAFAAIVVAILGLGAVAALRRPQAAAPSIPIARHPRIAQQTIASAEPAPRVLPVAPVQPARRHHSARHAPTHPLRVAAAGPPVSIQLQTSNPDIRIIWITR
jgi:hypothetical protein